ncbi:MAG: signal peptidase I [Actinomycetaceae bacterium]|nr:signal peptidase I [Actinomycetaceae bacterium]
MSHRPHGQSQPATDEVDTPNPADSHNGDHASTDEAPSSRRWVRVLREMSFIVVAALLLNIVSRALLMQTFWVPTNSMENTVLTNDRIVVARLSALTQNIQRGDLVVFEDAKLWLGGSGKELPWWENAARMVGLPTPSQEDRLLKRVIGVGGDHVECCSANGKITVNGTEITEEYLPVGTEPSQVHFSVDVPDGHLWVMGDNRSNSADSRYHLQQGDAAFIPTTAVVGTAVGVFWPANRWMTIPRTPAFDSVKSK